MRIDVLEGVVRVVCGFVRFWVYYFLFFGEYVFLLRSISGGKILGGELGGLRFGFSFVIFGRGLCFR